MVVEEGDGSGEVLVCYDEGFQEKGSDPRIKMRQETRLTVIIERSGGICFPDVNDIRVDDL